jgi:hypothetical protein
MLLARPAGAALRAGAAKADITPDVRTLRVPLGGYAARKGAPSTGVHDPVQARALVLAEGETKVGIVSLDLCFLPANVKAEIVKRVQAAGVKGLDADHLLIAATHAHTAPDPLAMHTGNTLSLKGWTPFDGKLLDYTAGKAAEAIVAADRGLVPAQAGCSVISAAGRNRNRRNYTITDPDMTLLRVTGRDGKPIAAIVNFAAHPTLYDDKMMDISADWPGAMTAEVEKSLGAGAVCLFLNGAEGDATTNGAEGKTAEERVADYGHKLAALVTANLPSVPVKEAVTLAAWTQVVTLPPRKPNGLFLAAAAQIGATIAQARQFVSALMPEKTVFGFVRVGDLLLIGCPCEPVTALGLEMKAAARRAGVALPAVVALSNDWLGYALTPEQYRDGNYEAAMSFYGDQLGPTLLTALKTGLESRHPER